MCPGSIPQGGANPGRRKHSSSCPRVLLWTLLLDDVVAPIAGRMRGCGGIQKERAAAGIPVAAP